jgi:Mce-associated membrane protein
MPETDVPPADHARGGTVTSESPTTDEAVESRAATTSTRLTLPRLLSALVIVLLAVAVVVSQWQLSDQRSLEGQRTSAVSAAKTDAVDVASYDYRHLAQDFGAVEHEATASFRRSFIKSSDALTKVLTQYHATAKATVLSAGLVSLSSTAAVVILFVNQTVANTAQKAPTTDDSRIKVTLDRSGGRWLISNLTLL